MLSDSANSSNPQAKTKVGSDILQIRLQLATRSAMMSMLKPAGEARFTMRLAHLIDLI